MPKITSGALVGGECSGSIWPTTTGTRTAIIRIRIILPVDAVPVFSTVRAVMHMYRSISLTVRTDGHVALNMCARSSVNTDDPETSHRERQTPEDGHTRGDYFSGVDTSGSNTPDPYSAFTTPDVSRPGTPTFEDVDIVRAVPRCLTWRGADESAQLHGERDGLPISSQRQAAAAFKRQAAKLVAVHKAKERFMSAGARKSHGQGVDADAVAAALRTVSPRASADEERPAQPAPAPAGKGVLSSLLRLYDGPQPPSMNSSQATLVHPTEESSRKTSTPPSSRPSFDHLQSVLKTARQTTDQVTRTVEEVSGKIGRNAERAYDNVTGAYERPAAARSGGGVFAALQASALDLAGAAAPSASTIRPATDKSGFRVQCVAGLCPDPDRC
jgi:hypothetical protein